MKISFKGYQAAPLKSIILEQKCSDKILGELSSIAKDERFAVKKTYDNDMWLQDNKIIIPKNDSSYCITRGNVSDGFFNDLANCGIKGERVCNFLTGGDTFLGKFKNGSKWLIMGDDNYLNEAFLKQISETYDVPLENIFLVPSPDFHLDMGIRPIDKNNILVNDFDMVKKLIPSLNDHSKEYFEYRRDALKYIANMKRDYHSCSEICNKLKYYGFNPIKVPGVWGTEVNFMNAIVNLHKDKTLSYITNSSKCSIPFYSKMEKCFEDVLRARVLNIRKIYYIKGVNPEKGEKINYIMQTLKYRSGGIHCMSLEEPNFHIWG